VSKDICSTLFNGFDIDKHHKQFRSGGQELEL